MKVVISIDGQEAIPIRAASYAACGRIGPLTIAMMLAGRYRDPTEPSQDPAIYGLKSLQGTFLVAYRYKYKNDYDLIPISEWDQFVDELLDLWKQYKKDESKTPSTNNNAFRELVATKLDILPSGVFVWRKDLQSVLDNIEWGEDDVLRGDDFKIISEPMLPAEFEKKIIEGFESFLKSSLSSSKPSKDREYILKTLGLMTLCYIKAAQSERLGSTDNPTIENLAEDMLQMAEDWCGEVPYGISGSSAMVDRVKEALQLLEQDR